MSGPRVIPGTCTCTPPALRHSPVTRSNVEADSRRRLFLHLLSLVCPPSRVLAVNDSRIGNRLHNQWFTGDNS